MLQRYSIIPVFGCILIGLTYWSGHVKPRPQSLLSAQESTQKVVKAESEPASSGLSSDLSPDLSADLSTSIESKTHRKPTSIQFSQKPLEIEPISAEETSRQSLTESH